MAVAVAGLALAALSIPAHADGGPALYCDGAERTNPGTSDRDGGRTPVVFIHGITSTAEVWNKVGISGGPSLITSLMKQVSTIPGLSTYTFDYGPYSLDWVDNPHLGPAFGKAISCLARDSGHKVAVVAHSMGGLVTRYAAALPSHDGGVVGDRLATVITVGTPYEGSLLASLAVGGIRGVSGRIPGGPLLAEILLAACGWASEKLPSDSPCSVVGTPDTPAGKALLYHSSQLAKLEQQSPWPLDLEVHALAGDIDYGFDIGFFNLHLIRDIGDAIVTPDSARAGGTTGEKEFDHCRNAINVGHSLCYHGNLMVYQQLVNRALAILSDLPPKAPSSPPSAGSNGNQTELVIDVSSSMGEAAGPVTKLAAAQRAAGDVLQLVAAEQHLRSESVGVITFSGEATVLAPLSTDVTSALTAINTLTTVADTNLGDGIRAALDSLSVTDADKVIILLSDGETNTGISRDEILSQLVPAASAQHVRIFTVALGDSNIDNDLLQQIAQGTGGQYTATTTLAELRQAFMTDRQAAGGVIVGANNGSIAQGQVLEASSVVVPRDQKLLEVSLAWDHGRLALELVDPKGKSTIVSPPPGYSAEVGAGPIEIPSAPTPVEPGGIPTSMPNITTRGDVTIVASNPEVLLVRTPRPGIWRVKVHGDSVPIGQTSFFTIASRQAGGHTHDEPPWRRFAVPGAIVATILCLIAVGDAVVVRRRTAQIEDA